MVQLVIYDPTNGDEDGYAEALAAAAPNDVFICELPEWQGPGHDYAQALQTCIESSGAQGVTEVFLFGHGTSGQFDISYDGTEGPPAGSAGMVGNVGANTSPQAFYGALQGCLVPQHQIYILACNVLAGHGGPVLCNEIANLAQGPVVALGGLTQLEPVPGDVDAWTTTGPIIRFTGNGANQQLQPGTGNAIPGVPSVAM